MEKMGERLRRARSKFFRSARAAAIAHGWSVSTYTAHENGQNDYDPQQAEVYAKAFKVSAEWLLLGTKYAPAEGPGIDAQLLDLPPDESKALIDRFNAMIEGVRLVKKLK